MTGSGAGDTDPVIEARLIVALRDLVDDETPSPDLRTRILVDLEASTPVRPHVPWLPIVAALLIAVVTVGALELSTRGNDAGVRAAADPGRTAPTSGPDPDACRNSTDPTCGAFRWDPTPIDRPATLTATFPDMPITVGDEHELTLVVSDPDGRVDLNCYSVDADRTALTVGACMQRNPGPCPDRHGPWTPPAPEPHEARTTTVIRFPAAGTYTLTIDVPRVPGCDNVEPFRSGASTQLVVDVVDPTVTN